MQETAEGTAGATAAARKWVVDKGWMEDDYRFAMSQVQSAPLGFVSVDVMCIRHEDADDAAQLLQRSRVLELNTETWQVEAVLAARDPVALKRQLDLEHVRVETENMEQHRREGKHGASGIGGDGAGDNTTDAGEMGVSDLLLSCNQDPASRLEEVEEEIERVRALQAALQIPKAGAPPTEEEESADAINEGAYDGDGERHVS